MKISYPNLQIISQTKNPGNVRIDLFNEKSFCRNLFNCSNCEFRLFTPDFKRKIFINLFPNYGSAKR